MREVRHQAITFVGAVPGICYVKLEKSFAYQDGIEPDALRGLVRGERFTFLQK